MRQRAVIFGILIAATLSIVATLRAQTADGPHQWLTDYTQARIESQRLGLPLLVHFSISGCGPCQQMERETLGTSALAPFLGPRFIGLKLDAEVVPELAEGFQVASYPTDLIVAPDGHIVWRSVGYQDRGKYVAQLKQWESRFDRERAEALAKLRMQQPAVVPNPTPNPMLNPMPDRSTLLTQKPMPLPSVNMSKPPQPLVGLEGYSPVRIKTARRWERGNAQFAVTYQGVVYYMTDENDHRLFTANPDRYVPRLLGCDPVQLVQTDRAIQGSVEIGAFFDGELFLFSSIESRNRFKIDPERYTQSRHVLNADEISGTRLR